MIADDAHERAMPPMRFTPAEYRAAAQAFRERATFARRIAADQVDQVLARGLNAAARRDDELAQKFELAAKWL